MEIEEGKVTPAAGEPTDVELVRAYRNGDVHAFEELHRRYVASIFRLVRRKLGDALLAVCAHTEDVRVRRRASPVPRGAGVQRGIPCVAARGRADPRGGTAASGALSGRQAAASPARSCSSPHCLMRQMPPPYRPPT